jgi:hypothetical protein
MFEQMVEGELDPIIEDTISNLEKLYSSTSQEVREQAQKQLGKVTSSSFYFEVLIQIIRRPTVSGSRG